MVIEALGDGGEGAFRSIVGDDGVDGAVSIEVDDDERRVR